MKYKIPKSTRPKYFSGVTKTGKLLDRLKPAAFCDTSFLLDYWNSSVHDPLYENHPLNQKDPIDKIFSDYLKADTRTRKIYSVRQKVENFESKLNLIYTPACRLELEEVITALRFRKYGVEVTESSLILKKGNKDIGDILSKLEQDYRHEFEKFGKEKMNEKLSMLFWHFFLTTDRINEGLEGMIEVDIKNFNFSKKDFFKIAFLANQQVGFADIFHLMTASNLGCEFFFTLDSDFKRIDTFAQELFNLKIVSDPQSILLKI